MARVHSRRNVVLRTIASIGLGAGLVLAGGSPAAAADPPPGVTAMTVTAASSGATGDPHFVAYPTDPGRRNGSALLFLGGSSGPATGYENITQYAAGLGYDALDLAYPNTQIIGVSCNNNDDCFENLRGETIFGQNVAYGAPVTKTWNSAATTVTAQNSIVGRTVGLLDHLETTDPRWSSYLVDDPTSPYSTPHHPGGVRPNWSRIVVAGHSQGGGNAAFIGIQVPVLRVALFSAPNDNVRNVPARWITYPSRTSLAHYSGLRNADEGSFGDNTSGNWASLGGPTGGGVGGPGHNAEMMVGDGSVPPGASQRLVLTSPDTTSLHNHDSTALDGAAGAGVRPAWTVLLNGTP